MAYTTNNLIADAYFASGIISREFETVSGTQFDDGFRWLNNVISEKDVDEGMVPYETTFTLNAVVGQESYSIPNCIKIDTLVFFKDTVRYAMEYDKRNHYFGAPRVESIESLPYGWYFERGFGGGTLFLYFLPDQTYPLEIHGIFRLSQVTQGQDLSLTIEQFFTTYLMYRLADFMCAQYNYTSPERVLSELGRYEAYINKKSRLIDLTMKKKSTLQQDLGLNWAYVNLSGGWVTR